MANRSQAMSAAIFLSAIVVLLPPAAESMIPPPQDPTALGSPAGRPPLGQLLSGENAGKLDCACGSKSPLCDGFAKDGNADEVERLLAEAFDPIPGTRRGTTTKDTLWAVEQGLRTATENGHADVVEVLLKNAPDKINTVWTGANSGVSLLSGATILGHVEVVKVLLKPENDPPVNIDQADNLDGNFALIWAVNGCNDIPAPSPLSSTRDPARLAKPSDLKEKDWAWYTWQYTRSADETWTKSKLDAAEVKRSALCEASKEIIRLLLENDPPADPNQSNKRRQTPEGPLQTPLNVAESNKLWYSDYAHPPIETDYGEIVDLIQTSITTNAEKKRRAAFKQAMAKNEQTQAARSRANALKDAASDNDNPCAEDLEGGVVHGDEEKSTPSVYPCSACTGKEDIFSGEIEESDGICADGKCYSQTSLKTWLSTISEYDGTVPRNQNIPGTRRDYTMADLERDLKVHEDEIPEVCRRPKPEGLREGEPVEKPNKKPRRGTGEYRQSTLNP